MSIFNSLDVDKALNEFQSAKFRPGYAWESSAVRIQRLLLNLNITATPAEINAVAAGASRVVTVTDAASYTVLAANSGKMHIMPNFTASCTLTFPTAVAGLNYKFIGKAVAADAQDWIFTAVTPSFLLGGVSFTDTDAGSGADEEHAGVWPNGSSHLVLTVVTPGAGTEISFWCDGTNWIVNGQVHSATVPTVA